MGILHRDLPDDNLLRSDGGLQRQCRGSWRPCAYFSYSKRLDVRGGVRPPHFPGQPDNLQVFWAYAFHPDRIGNFVAKPMTDCTGAEILAEVCGHLNFDRSVFNGAICIPCRMPYITSMFMPRSKSDRPLPVPKNSKNLAFVSQFVEIPEDVVFTVEYSSGRRRWRSTSF